MVVVRLVCWKVDRVLISIYLVSCLKKCYTLLVDEGSQKRISETMTATNGVWNKGVISTRAAKN